MRDEIRPSEILERLKQKIAGFDEDPQELEVGRVVQSGDGIVQAWGLPEVLAGELVEVDTGEGVFVQGMVMNLEEDTVGIILFDGADSVKEGHLVRRTKRLLEVPVGECLLGRVVDALGTPMDGLGPLNAIRFRPIEAKGPGIIDRQNVCEPLQTGIKAVDAMIPIGCGQRELIIGDRRTGKTTLALDTILNQKRFAGQPQQIHCFYVAIGQKRSSVVRLVELLRNQGALGYTTVVAATASDAASLLYLAPYAAVAMAEDYRDSGRHALVVFDDLTKHAQAYRELSLLMRRSPGREAFPGDIFYVHSRLLERAAKMSAARGGGSLTALPIVETLEGDVAAYIPTNVISITDGQIFLTANLFHSGLRPAINVGVSVSRVGGEAQVRAMKQVAGSLRIDLAQFRELAAFLQFSSELDPATRRQLDRGSRLVEILKQDQYSPLEVYHQVMILKAGISGRLDRYPLNQLSVYQGRLIAYLEGDGSGFLDRLRSAGAFDPALEAEAEEVFLAVETLVDSEGGLTGEGGLALNLAVALGQENPGRTDPIRLADQLTSHEGRGQGFNDELDAVFSARDPADRQRFEAVLRRCTSVDSMATSRTEVFREAATHWVDRLQTSAASLATAFEGQVDVLSPEIPPFFAVSSVTVGPPGTLELLMARSQRGIEDSPSRPSVHGVFVVGGAEDQRHLRLVVLAMLASVMPDPAFQKRWLDGPPEDLPLLVRDWARR